MFATSPSHTSLLCRNQKQAASASSSRLVYGTGKTGVRAYALDLRHTRTKYSFPLVDAARRVDPSLPAGNTSYDPKNAVYMLRYDATKSARILGLKFRGMDETAADTLKGFMEKGWLQ